VSFTLQWQVFCLHVYQLVPNVTAHWHIKFMVFIL
jgi:hypothetical protein